MDEVCQSLARRVFVQVPLDLRLDTCFPFIHVSFEEDSINTLGKVGLGSPGCAGLFGYQFTTANPMGQTEMWTATENWINKQKDSRIILQGDLNSAHPGGRWDYAQPLNKDIGMADKKLEHCIKPQMGTSKHSRNIPG